MGTGATATGATPSFGAKAAGTTANTIPPQKLTYEQLDATTKKLVEGVQYPSKDHEIVQFLPLSFDFLCRSSFAIHASNFISLTQLMHSTIQL
jgi:hypothetical protein